MQGGPNINDEIFPGWRNPENFIVVSDPYPSVSAVAADLILPTCMWVEKEGGYGNAERRTQLWRQQVKGQVSLVLTYGKLLNSLNTSKRMKYGVKSY